MHMLREMCVPLYGLGWEKDRRVPDIRNIFRNVMRMLYAIKCDNGLPKRPSQKALPNQV